MRIGGERTRRGGGAAARAALLLLVALLAALIPPSPAAATQLPSTDIDALVLRYRPLPDGRLQIYSELFLKLPEAHDRIVLRLPWNEEHEHRITGLAYRDTGQGSANWQRLTPLEPTSNNGQRATPLDPGYQISLAKTHRLLSITLPTPHAERLQLKLDSEVSDVVVPYRDGGLLTLPVVEQSAGSGVMALQLEFDYSALSELRAESIDSQLQSSWPEIGLVRLERGERRIGWTLGAYPMDRPLTLRLVIPNGLMASERAASDARIRPELEAARRNQALVGSLRQGMARQLQRWMPLILAAAAALVALALLQSYFERTHGSRRPVETSVGRPAGLSRAGFACLLDRRVRGDALYAAIVGLVADGRLSQAYGRFGVAEGERAAPSDAAEAILLEGLVAFEREHGRWNSADLQRAAGRRGSQSTLAGLLADYGAAVRRELIEAGLIGDWQRLKLRLIVLAACLLVASPLLAVLSQSYWPLLLLPLVLVLLVHRHRMRTLSREGFVALRAGRAYVHQLAHGGVAATAEASEEARIAAYLDALAVGHEGAYLEQLRRLDGAQTALTPGFFRQAAAADLAQQVAAEPDSAELRRAASKRLAERASAGRMDMSALLLRSRLDLLR